MAIQRRNDEMVDLLGADFQKRKESAFAWSTAMGVYQTLPGLRGFWPMSAFTATGNALSFAGSSQTRVLTYNGNPAYNFDGLAPYIRFDGTGDYLSRADEAGFDITGTETYVAAGHRGLTLGGWFRPESNTATEALISKWQAAANLSYILLLDGTVAGDPVSFLISDDGANASTVSSTSGFSTNTWQFMAGRFNDADTGAELAIWLNDEMTTAATARNSIFSGAAPFNISGYNNGTQLFTGRASLCFLCACALADATVWAIYQRTRALFKV